MDPSIENSWKFGDDIFRNFLENLVLYSATKQSKIM